LSIETNKQLVRNAFKIVLPPLLGCAMLFAFDMLYFYIKNFGNVTITASSSWAMSVAKYFFLPTLFVATLLLQGFMVLPIWNRLANQPRQNKAVWIRMLCFFLLITSIIGGSLLSSEPYGLVDIVITTVLVLAVQLAYWVINLFILYWLDKSQISHLNTQL